MTEKFFFIGLICFLIMQQHPPFNKGLTTIINHTNNVTHIMLIMLQYFVIRGDKK